MSYSHADEEWLDRFELHVAVLERRGLVDLWSDTRIGVGARWEEEIESALTAAKVAVLLVSPAFLASKYVWSKEMPRIVDHAKQGMKVVPLIIRPCAWKLEEDLAQFQACPRTGLPLSLVSDGQVDLELSELVYQLGAQIGRSPAALDLSSSEVTRADVTDLSGEWTGHYNGTRPIRLLIGEVVDNGFHGRMEYPEEGTTTNVEGTIHDKWSSSDRRWAQIGAADEGQGIALSFRETNYQSKGSGSISFDGEYRTLVRGDQMAGAWFSGSRLVGPLTLNRTKDQKPRSGAARSRSIR